VKEVKVKTRTPHYYQSLVLESKAKRKIVKAGRRSGKTVGVALGAIDDFIDGCRVLYAAPTGEQTDAFWYEVILALNPLLKTGIYKLNETERFIEKIGTQNRIKAKTAWNANTMRGDYADRLILDEWQLMAEDAWDEVGAPMLMDNNGDATFVYTPPSLRSSGISRARDPLHAAEMFKMAQADKTGLWEAFHFTSFDNPHLSTAGLELVSQDMSRDSYLKEIMAEDEGEQLALLVYGAFKEAICKVNPFPIPEHWPIYSGHDFGGANPAALFIAHDRDTGLYWAFNEYRPDSGRSTYQNVEAFKEIISLGDSRVRDVVMRVGGSHQEDEIRQGYTAHGWPITEPRTKGVGAQVDRVTGILESNRLMVFNTLTHYLGELNSCLWKLDTEGKRTNEIKDEKRYHLSACARYLLSDFRPDTIVEQKEAQVWQY